MQTLMLRYPDIWPDQELEEQTEEMLADWLVLTFSLNTKTKKLEISSENILDWQVGSSQLKSINEYHALLIMSKNCYKM